MQAICREKILSYLAILVFSSGAITLGANLFCRADAAAPANQAGSEQGSPESRIYLDFSAKEMVIYGRYSPGAQGALRGTEAELAARKEGKKNLTSFVEGICKSSELSSAWKERLSLIEDWNANGVVSQGSEIFPGAVLLLKLSMPFSQIFTKYPPIRSSAVEKEDDGLFYFKIPPLPASSIKCGLIGMKVGDGSQQIEVAPAFLAKVPNDGQLITLHLSGGVLTAASKNDSELLRKSGFGLGGASEAKPGMPIFLPIVQRAQ